MPVPKLTDQDQALLALVPTLLIPIWGVTGEVVLYHHRPDSPRIREGKPAKYEFPAKSRMAVDIHPMIRDQVRNPALPLFITEGAAPDGDGLCGEAGSGPKWTATRNR